MRVRRAIVFVAAVSASCSTPLPPPATASTPLVAPTVIATGPAGVPVVLPTYTLSGALPAALLVGKLAYNAPCVTISDELGTVYQLIWPAGFSARWAGDIVRIVGPDGRVFGTDSGISLGGGAYEGDSARVLRDSVVNLPSRCDREPFWLVADVISP